MPKAAHEIHPIDNREASLARFRVNHCVRHVLRQLCETLQQRQVQVLIVASALVQTRDAERDV